MSTQEEQVEPIEGQTEIFDVLDAES